MDSAIGRLRRATGEAHASLESAVDVVARLKSPSERPGLIANYQAMYAGAAYLLAPWFADGEEVLSAGVARAGAAPADGIPSVHIENRAEALGFRYVIEGSALGGRMILRELVSQGVDTAELGFLHPHGARTGEVWRGFCGLVERELASTPGALDEAVAGAMKGFAYARACLVGELLPT